ncbi:Hypothetical protein HEAR2360 [Herminiimonas arsenicoxydans]|uniref:Uncharacterized protein n=1 Tax=Herminiimonas arsenicoxydans TaxID=204773 RepID=A4G7K4_HERAR|nr:Hypothetical protein HEAR2360 [Herminiimonas arsenicoxydans]
MLISSASGDLIYINQSGMIASSSAWLRLDDAVQKCRHRIQSTQTTVAFDMDQWHICLRVYS